MIWVGGRVVPDDALKVSVLDRTFEHGLGLFETFRTWDGRAPLLDRHLARLLTSARELALPLDPVALPDGRGVAELLEAEGHGGDRLLRVTLSGGLNEEGGSLLWMRSAPLPAPMRHDGAVVELGPWFVGRHDRLARHKALNYWTRRLAYESARRVGFDEVLSWAPGRWVWEGSHVWEGSRTNLFFVKEATLGTPRLDGPLVPGVMRGVVLERARELPLTVTDAGNLLQKNLMRADEVFLTNSVRGIVPVARLVFTREGGTSRDWTTPGPWTKRLMLLVSDWLEQQGGPPT